MSPEPDTLTWGEAIRDAIAALTATLAWYLVFGLGALLLFGCSSSQPKPLDWHPDPARYTLFPDNPDWARFDAPTALGTDTPASASPKGLEP